MALRRLRSTWRRLFSGLGESILDVLRAEATVVAEEWKRSGVLLRNAAIVAVALLFCFFWWIPLAIFGVVQLFTLIPGVGMLGATWIVVGLGLLAMGGAGAWTWFAHVRHLESPVASVKRRVADHMEWWNTKILPAERTLTAGEEGGELDGRDR